MTLQEQLTERILALPGVTAGTSRFSANPAFYRGKRELAHFHPDGVIDIRLTKAVIRELELAHADDPRLVLRRSASDWVEFRFTTAGDLDRAVELVEHARAANG